MAYNIYYPSDCDSEIPDHVCSDCSEVEHGRVRSIAFIKKSFSFIDPTNPVEWTNGIKSKAIIIIPNVNGTFDGGKATTAEGYGDQQTKFVAFTHTLQFKDPDYKVNGAFYNAIKQSNNYYVAFKTETQVHVGDSSVQVTPTNPVTTNTTDEVVWDVSVVWTSGNVLEPLDAPAGTFTCFEVE